MLNNFERPYFLVFLPLFLYSFGKRPHGCSHTGTGLGLCEQVGFLTLIVAIIIMCIYHVSDEASL